MSRQQTLPAIYSQVVLRMAQEAGLGLSVSERDALLKELGIPKSLILGVGTRVPIDLHQNLIRRLLQHAEQAGRNNGGVGYQMGLRLKLASHGVVAFAGMSQLTVRTAVELFIRFSKLILPTLRARLFVDDETAVLDLHTDPPVAEDLRRHFYDMLLVSLWHAAIPIAGDMSADIELCFDYPEPDYYTHFRKRLPRCQFNMEANQLCFPARYLDRRLATGDPVTAKTLEEQCVKQLQLLGEHRDVTAAVRRLLRNETGSYPDLDVVSTQLFMSRRTLNRKLKQDGTSYLELLREAKLDEASLLLTDTALSIESIAVRLGYSDPANFTHAFRSWTGMSPSRFRKRPDRKAH